MPLLSFSAMLIDALAWYGMFINIFYFLIFLAALVFILVYINKEPPQNHPRYNEGVSIIKPLLGVDLCLEENLTALSKIDYPKFEVIFCLEDGKDKARLVAERFIEEHPKIDSRISIGNDISVVNGKIRNVLNGYLVMKYDLFWICDARIKVDPNSLKDLICRVTDKTGLVHAMPSTIKGNPKTMGALLEKITFSCQFARVYISAHLLGLPSSVGMSNVLRKSYLEATCRKGLKDFSKFMAEDHHMAVHVLRSARQLQLASKTAQQNSGDISVDQHYNRMLRWAKLRFYSSPIMCLLLEPFTGGLISSLIFSFSVHHVMGWNATFALFGHTGALFLLDFLYLVLLEGNLRVPWHRLVTGWMLYHLMASYVIIAAIARPTIEWKSRRYRLHFDGTYEVEQ